jgi:hypothetical protein
MVIDFHDLSEADIRTKYCDVWQHLRSHVFNQRDALKDRTSDAAEYARSWWKHGKTRPELRRALSGLDRYIATVETTKHRPFCFLPTSVVPDNMLICIATDDAFHLGVLSSRFHVSWSLAAGGRLGVGNDPRYNKTRCFDPFPFPFASAPQRAAIAAIAEELDSLRRARLDTHPQLTMTGLYNVLEKLRTGQPLTPAERDIHDAGHVSILKRLHDDLDAAVAEAYGWPVDLSAPEIVARVVALNIARRAEEESGLVHWLRPEFQAPTEQRRVAQTTMAIAPGDETGLPAWPARDPERYVALRSALSLGPARPADLTKRFQRANTAKIRTMLETLSALGQVRLGQDGLYRG